MIQSEGVRRVVEAYAQAVSTGDLETAGGLIDGGEEVLIIGTDPDEWWKGRDRVMSVYRAQQAEMGTQVSVSSFELDTALEIGEAGWFAGRILITGPDGGVPVRVSGVARRRDDDWRIVHLHVSVGAENEETLGMELPT
jgi:ketosteroid isomerase-like protein